jgi:hypothetical protein
VFTLDINLSDGKTHKISLYAYDSFHTRDIQNFTIKAANGGAILASQDLSSFFKWRLPTMGDQRPRHYCGQRHHIANTGNYQWAVGQGALSDPAVVAKALAQQDGGGRAAIGDRFDIHGCAFRSNVITDSGGR